MTSRTLATCHPAHRDDIGDLITRRPLPNSQRPHFDPFLFLNHHGPQHYPANNHGLPFAPHPHRGFETVTFIISGSLAHADSTGHESIIEAGGVQWMTAGAGVVHSELSPAAFKAQGGDLEILQLWLNLPARLKMTEPRYLGFQQDDLPHIPLPQEQGKLTLVAGQYQQHRGPVTPLVDEFIALVTIDETAPVTLPAPAQHHVFLYVVSGEVTLAGEQVSQWHWAELSAAGDEVIFTATPGSQLLYGYAQPFGEPVVSYGPFVMNSEQEIRQAISDYQAGLFSTEFM